MRIVRKRVYPCRGAASGPICELLSVSFYGPMNRISVEVGGTDGR